MKKIVSFAFTLVILSVATAQTTTDTKKTNLVDRASDHFMIQLSTDHWANMPDSISPNQKGFSRGLSIYFMIDKPFKSDPRYSIAFGLGVGNSNIFFQNMTVLVEQNSPTLQFPTVSSANANANHYKKYKLATSYLEVPIEIRYTAHPERENKSFKLAFGLKPGVILDAHTKAKDLLNSNGGIVDDYVQKESSTYFFPTARLITTARVGYGNFSIFGNYQVTSLFTSGTGPNIQFFQVGLGISGL
jgi:hypothetical protein